MAFSLICTLVSFPLLLARNGKVSWGSLFFGPSLSQYFTAFLLPLLASLYLCQLLGVLGRFTWLLELGQLSIRFLQAWLEFLDRLPGQEWILGRQPVWILLLLVGLVLFVFQSFLSDRYKKRSLLVLGLGLMLLRCNQFLRPTGQVVMIDIGQGDCFYLESPFQQGSYLLDCGGIAQFGSEEAWARRNRMTAASRAILPVLTAEGTDRLDGIIITHGDYDHYGSLNEVLKEVSVDHLYLSLGMKKDKEALASIHKGLAQSRNSHVKVHWVRAGQVIDLKGGPRLFVLGPNEEGEGKNEDSLITYGRFGPLNFLFTGDAVGPKEEAGYQLVQRLGWSVDVLKIAHHGSDQSSPDDYLDQLQPRLAMISVGKNNSYGHPSPRIIDHLNRLGTQTYRTDLDGGVYYYYTPYCFWIQTAGR